MTTGGTFGFHQGGIVRIRETYPEYGGAWIEIKHLMEDDVVIGVVYHQDREEVILTLVRSDLEEIPNTSEK